MAAAPPRGGLFASGGRLFVDDFQHPVKFGNWQAGGIPVGGGGLSSLVKPFTPAELLLQKLQRLRPKDGEETEAEVTWGKPSEFKVSDSSFEDDGDGVIVDWPKDDDDLEEFGITIPTLQFVEFDRETETIRVENPDDSDQYVMVERINTITFKGPDLRPLDAAGGLKEGVLTISDPETGRAFTAKGIPQSFRLPYIYYKFTLHNH